MHPAPITADSLSIPRDSIDIYFELTGNLISCFKILHPKFFTIRLSSLLRSRTVDKIDEEIVVFKQNSEIKFCVIFSETIVFTNSFLENSASFTFVFPTSIINFKNPYFYQSYKNQLVRYELLIYFFILKKRLNLQTLFVGTLAQLVEQWTENPCVPGSIPGGTT